MARIDNDMQAQYNRALVRALEAGLKVREITPTTWVVVNPSNNHESYVQERTQTLECSCKAGVNGAYCMHRAVVRAYLTSKRASATERERVAQYRLELAAQAAEQAGEIWAEQENERVLTNSLLRTDDARALGVSDSEDERLNWMGMSKDERAAWILARS